MHIHLARELDLPVDAVTQKQAFLGMSGSGKTYGAGVFVEGLLAMGAQVVVLDVVGNWYGLRIGAKGTGEGFKIPVFGGDHGDIPLEPTGGAIIADAVVDYGISAVLDLHLFRKNQRKQFMTDFAEQLFHRKKSSKSPLHVVLEECQMYIPQKTFKGEERMLGAMEDLCKLGRNYGIGYSLISQRPQAVNKDVVNQTGTVYAFRMTGPQERKVMEGWLSEQTGAIAGDMIESLPFLENGECWVWSPQWLKVFKRVHIAKKQTFDASATPVFGAKAEKAKALAPVDLEQLKTAMSATIEKAKADDPKALRAEIVKLKAELSKGQKPQTVETVKEISVLGKHDIERLEGWTAKAEELAGKLSAAAKDIRDAIGKVQPFTVNRLQGVPSDLPRKPLQRVPTVQHVPVSAEHKLSASQRKILNALAWAEGVGLAYLDKTQLALMADQSPTSGGYFNNLGTLRTAGMIEYPGAGTAMLTDSGREQAEPGDIPTTSADLQDMLYRKLSSSQANILRRLVAIYPVEIQKDVLAEQTNQSPTSGGYFNNLGRLRTLGLIDYPRPGFVVAKAVLFLDGGHA
jgi:hypothetical protein